MASVPELLHIGDFLWRAGLSTCDLMQVFISLVAHIWTSFSYILVVLMYNIDFMSVNCISNRKSWIYISRVLTLHCLLLLCMHHLSEVHR